MCTRHDAALRFGSRLEHGPAHQADHRRWTRRDFLRGLGAGAASVALALGSTPVRAFGHLPMLGALQGLDSDRVLVLIQLTGGNDGLNTVVPYSNDLYYQRRPRLAVPQTEVFALNGDLGLHPALAPLEPLWGNGQMALVQGVGYPDPNLSHFRATDIWLSGSEAEVYDDTGWLGRYLDQVYPDFPAGAPEAPLAVQLGNSQPLLFQGAAANMGMNLSSPERFARIADQGTLYDETNVPDTHFGAEMGFLRAVANDAFQYAGHVQTASQNAENSVDYPTAGNRLAENLAIVARLIKGGLGARIYQVSLSGFDTHAGQTNTHAGLLTQVAGAVDAFQADLAAQGYDGQVLTMTFSEFGRRVEENGSAGTDHGTAAPLFLFGPGVAGGLHGLMPSLSDLDPAGNLKHTTDFRAVYSSVLNQWFGLPAEAVTGLFGQAFAPLGFISDVAATGTATEAVPAAFTLLQNHPNPFSGRTTLRYELMQPAPVHLRVYDARGRLVQTLVNEPRPAGPHTVAFTADRLPSGTYLYRLDTPAGTRTRKMTHVR